MKMCNARSGHAPSFGIEAIYFIIGLVIGFPVAIPVFFVIGYLSEKFGFRMNNPITSVLLYASMVVGIYVHFKIWQWLYFVLKAWLVG